MINTTIMIFHYKGIILNFQFMIKSILTDLRKYFAIAVCIIMTACTGLGLLGCFKDYLDDYDYAIKIAKEKYGCTTILWVDSAGFMNNLTYYRIFKADGEVMKGDFILPPEGGAYLVGKNNSETEIFLIVPPQKYVEGGSKDVYQPYRFEWPFNYSFTEISKFAEENSLQHAADDGTATQYDKSFSVYDKEEKIKSGVALNDIDELYEELDVKFVFTFRLYPNKTDWFDYYVMQKGGELIMYEVKNYDSDNAKMFTYNREDK